MLVILWQKSIVSFIFSNELTICSIAFLDEYNRQSKNIKDNHEYIHQRLIEHSARHAEVLEEDYMGRLNPEDRDENYVEGINELRRIVRYGVAEWRMVRDGI